MTVPTRLSKFDQLYRSVCLSKFFTKGWGEPEKLRRCVEFRPNFLTRDSCARLLVNNDNNYRLVIEKEEIIGKTKIIEGHFLSPLANHLPEIVRAPVDKAYFQMVLPISPATSCGGRFKPLVIQLAGTGDHFFGRRRLLMANPLAKEHGVASILLENPFYGFRKPKEQRRSSLCNVMDLFVMGGCLILECLVLLDWCEREGYWPLALHGVSMGGHMASLAAGSYSKPVALVPCLSWSTASCAFTTGVMSNSIPWSLLQSQYLSNRGLPAPLLVDPPPEPQHVSADDALSVAAVVSSSSNSSSGAAAASLTANSKLRLLINDVLVKPIRQLKHRHSKLAAKVAAANTANSSMVNNNEFAARNAVVGHLRRVMDDFTHLDNFPKPIDQSLIIAVAANHDAYLPRDGVTNLADVWPDAEIRYLDRGHVGAFLFDQPMFRKAIVDALNRVAEKYDPPQYK